MTVTRPPTAAMADLEAQIASLTELMAQHPRRVDLVFGRASAYRSAGKLEEAVADFAKVRALVWVSVCVCVCVELGVVCGCVRAFTGSIVKTHTRCVSEAVERAQLSSAVMYFVHALHHSTQANSRGTSGSLRGGRKSISKSICV